MNNSITDEDIREREYQMLVSKLKVKKMFLDKKLFIAVLNVITNLETERYSKVKAIRYSANQQNVKQSEIKEILDTIGYLSPTQRILQYNLAGIQEGNELEHVMSFK